jgi:predicted NUDIX family NTP pyrophosphohydrolase
MPVKSAGLLPFRWTDGAIEVFLVHPGGPFWARKDEGAWSIAKGEYDADEEAVDAARREYTEETGLPAPEGVFIPLAEVKQRGGKMVSAWAVETNFDATTIISGTFTMEWPPRSGQMQSFPEVDRAAWFRLEEAERRILAGQRPFLAELRARFPE